MGDYYNDTQVHAHLDMGVLSLWHEVYRSKASWLQVRYRTVDQKWRKRRMLSPASAQSVCREMNNLTFAEPPKIEADEWIADLLSSDKVMRQMREWSELVLALGGGAMKLRKTNLGVMVDFVPAYLFEATYVRDGEIVGAKFTTYRGHKDKKERVVEEHTPVFDEDGSILLYNVSEKVYRNSSKPASVINSVVDTRVPLFAYVKAPKVNTSDVSSPYGESLFGGSLDVIESVDTTYDAINTEIKLGKRRIVVPSGVIRTGVDDEGNKVQYFDPTDEVFVGLTLDGVEKLEIQDLSPELRIEDLQKALNMHLDLLSRNCGFSGGYFSYSGGGIKTATEVISENSKTYQTRAMYQSNITAGLVGIIEGLKALALNYDDVGYGEEVETLIAWDDSVIEDRNAKATYWSGLVSLGLASKKQAIMAVHRLSEEQAEQVIQQIATERSAELGLEVDSLMTEA